MSTEKTDAIVVRTVPWSESSCVVTLFTRDFGRISALAKGAWRPKSPFESALDLLAFCRVVFLRKTGDSLHLLTEAKLQRCFRSGQRNLTNTYAGYYVAELLRELTEEGEAPGEIFDLTDRTLLDLDSGGETGAIVVRFELQLLRLLGHLPTWGHCIHCDRPVPPGVDVNVGLLAGGVLCSRCSSGQRQLIRIQAETLVELNRFSHPDWMSTELSSPSKTCNHEVRSIIERYLSHHFDKRWRMHPYLESLGR